MYIFPCKHCGQPVERTTHYKNGFACLDCKAIMNKKSMVERMHKKINKLQVEINKLEDRITKIVATIK